MVGSQRRSLATGEERANRRCVRLHHGLIARCWFAATLVGVIACAERNAVAAKMQATERAPVILVHGFADTSARMQKMARVLREDGWEVYTPTVKPSWGEV